MMLFWLYYIGSGRQVDDMRRRKVCFILLLSCVVLFDACSTPRTDEKYQNGNNPSHSNEEKYPSTTNPGTLGLPQLIITEEYLENERKKEMDFWTHEEFKKFNILPNTCVN